MKIKFLGTGTSVGVPVIGCFCDVCTSNNPKNTRTRSSLYLETDNSQFVIDTSMDFRDQCLREEIEHLDFILYTHAHADHIGGLDDIRPLTLEDQRIPAYGKPQSLKRIRSRFDYIFQDTPNDSWKPEIVLHELTETRKIMGVPIEPLPIWHGELKIYGYRVHNLAYISDVSKIPDSTFEKLENLDVLIIDALRQEPHPTHLTIDRAIQISKKINPERTFFTHMTHTIEHEHVSKQLPDTIELAYDGLTFCL